MSERVFQRWPDGLKKRVADHAGEREVTRFTVEALEKALGGESETAARSRGSRRGNGLRGHLAGSGGDREGQAGSIPASLQEQPDAATVAQSTAPPASSRASSPEVELLRKQAERDVAENGGYYSCRVPHCDFRARSAAAVCNVHGRKVDPVLVESSFEGS